MNAEKRDSIYNRLLSFKMKIDVAGVPNPRYLNEKLGECRVYLDEIERYSIETYQALSAIQQALNTAIADYETKQEGLLTTEDIKSLPSDKVRGAQVNNLLKAEISAIKMFENELQSLNYLLKALTLKNKNITSDNADLKAHIKIMEAQIKLGSGSMADPAVRSLLEEFKKSNINKDAFEDVSVEVSEEYTVDPSSPININNLLSQGAGEENLPDIDSSNNLSTSEDSDEEEPDEPEEDVEVVLKPDESGSEIEKESGELETVADNLLDPDPVLDPETNGEAPSSEEGEEEEPILNDPLEGFNIDEQDETLNDVETIIDLEQVIDFTQTKGEPSQIFEKVVEAKVKIVRESEEQKEETKEPDLIPDTAIIKETALSSGLDLDSLLDDLNLS